MNFIRRWRHGAERHQEQLLVKLWTINTMDADEDLRGVPQPAKLALEAKSELRSSLKYLSSSELERTVASAVSESTYNQLVLQNLRRQLNHNRPR
jgi:hypothetical protein